MKKFKITRKAVFFSTMNVLTGGNKKLQYIEEKIDLVDETILMKSLEKNT